MMRLLLLAATTVLFVSLTACGDETIEERVNRRIGEAVSEATGAKINLDSLGRKVARAVEGIEVDSIKLDGLSDVEVIGFRDLKPLMPTTADGLAREKHLGETSSAFGITFSTATATYGSGEHRIEAKLTDSGGAGMLVSSLAGFAGYQVDRETESGSERTFTLDGHSAYEKYSNRNGRQESNLSVLVHDRFIVQLEGVGVDANALQDVFRAFDLAQLPKKS